MTMGVKAAQTTLRRHRPIAGLLLFAMLMAACGGADEVDTPAAQSTSTDAVEATAGSGEDAAANVPTAPENVAGDIRFSWWGGQIRNEKTNAVIDLFEEAYPNVTIQRETGEFTPHWEKLTVQAAANDQPCVIQMQSRYMASYAPRGILLPLEDLVEAGAIDTSGVSEVFMQTGRHDGTLYAIPTGVFYYTVMYNEDYLTEAGLEPPSADWTWDDFKQMLLDSVGNLPEGVYASANSGIDPDAFYPYVQSQGQQVFSDDGLGFDKQVMIDWFTMWEELREAGATVPPEMAAEEPEALEQTYLAEGRIMLDTKAANQLDAHQDGLDASPQFSGTLRMQKHPNGPAGAGDDLQTNGMSIGSNCPEEDVPAAAAWINFFLNDEEAAQIYASDNGVVTVDRLREQQRDDPNTLPGQTRNIELLEEILEFEPEPASYLPGYGALEAAQKRAYESVMFGAQTIEEAVDEYFAEAEQVFSGMDG